MVELAFKVSAGEVVSTVLLWAEEFAQITFLTRREMKAISHAVIENATLIAVAATKTVPTFLVGRLSVTSHLGMFASAMLSILLNLAWRYELKLASAETARQIMLGLVQLQSLKLILDRVAGTLFRGALVEIASVDRKFLAHHAHKVVAFLGHAWVAQITLLSLDLRLHSRLQDCLAHCDGGGDLVLLRHLLLRLEWLRLRRPQFDPLLLLSSWR